MVGRFFFYFEWKKMSETATLNSHDSSDKDVLTESGAGQHKKLENGGRKISIRTKKSRLPFPVSLLASEFRGSSGGSFGHRLVMSDAPQPDSTDQKSARSNERGLKMTIFAKGHSEEKLGHM
jgi:hypothetical protein